MYTYVYTHIYIYRERERLERERYAKRSGCIMATRARPTQVAGAMIRPLVKVQSGKMSPGPGRFELSKGRN